MQLPEQADRVIPVEFEDIPVAGSTIRKIYSGDDIVLQVLKGDKSLPDTVSQRVAKALIETLGEPAMNDITIEDIKDGLLEGGRSVFVRCRGMNTEIINDIMFPRFYRFFEGTMQEP